MLPSYVGTYHNDFGAQLISIPSIQRKEIRSYVKILSVIWKLVINPFVQYCWIQTFSDPADGSYCSEASRKIMHCACNSVRRHKIGMRQMIFPAFTHWIFLSTWFPQSIHFIWSLGMSGSSDDTSIQSGAAIYQAPCYTYSLNKSEQHLKAKETLLQ